MNTTALIRTNYLAKGLPPDDRIIARIKADLYYLEASRIHGPLDAVTERRALAVFYAEAKAWRREKATTAALKGYTTRGHNLLLGLDTVYDYSLQHPIIGQFALAVKLNKDPKAAALKSAQDLLNIFFTDIKLNG
jgi:hypothetical protein